MSLSKGNTRPRFQVALEDNSATLVGELDYHIDGPWTVTGGVRTATGIMLGESSRHV
jgi:hypothetical protein